MPASTKAARIDRRLDRIEGITSGGVDLSAGRAEVATVGSDGNTTSLGGFASPLQRQFLLLKDRSFRYMRYEFIRQFMQKAPSFQPNQFSLINKPLLNVSYRHFFKLVAAFPLHYHNLVICGVSLAYIK